MLSTLLPKRKKETCTIKIGTGLFENDIYGFILTRETSEVLRRSFFQRNDLFRNQISCILRKNEGFIIFFPWR
ncbi:MAG: hypothetical protein CSYNP_02286 [Syntrophus sp. SKADARSKE-3]|nr:hypothetical protein [Syntrophus sp. SKADARSKE-3]